MKSKWILVALALAVPVAFSTAAFAEEPKEAAKGAYLGSTSCKVCHVKEFKSWEQTKHAKAIELLKAEAAKEAKTKHKLDPAKDYTQDKACLACHVTGWGKPGGYAIPDLKDEKAVKDAEKLAGAGCESCHGGGAGYMQLKKEIKKEKRKYKVAELEAAGMTKVTAQTCTACHNEKSPTYDESKKFDFEKMSKTEGGVHAHEPLTLKEG